MQPRNRPEKVRQHTVPKRYLRGFASPEDRLVQYERDTVKAYPVHVDDASVIKRFYSVKLADGTWNDSIEDYLMRLEEHANPILDKLVAGQAVSKEEKCKFALYLARQIQRGRFIASFAQAEAAKFLDKNFVAQLLEANRSDLVRRYGAGPLELALRDFQANPAGVVIDPKTYLVSLIRTTPPYAAIIADMPWRIEQAADGEFITSDQPVCVRRRTDVCSPNMVGLQDDGAELTFPLTKTMVLVASKNSGGGCSSVDSARVLEMNRVRVICAFQYLFATAESECVRTLITGHKNDRVRFKEMQWVAESS